MSKALFGEGPDYESFKEYFREFSSHQALYAAQLMMLGKMKEACRDRYDKNEEKKKKAKK